MTYHFYDFNFISIDFLHAWTVILESVEMRDERQLERKERETSIYAE